MASGAARRPSYTSTGFETGVVRPDTLCRSTRGSGTSWPGSGGSQDGSRPPSPKSSSGQRLARLRYTAGPPPDASARCAASPRPGLRQADPQAQPAGQLTTRHNPSEGGPWRDAIGLRARRVHREQLARGETDLGQAKPQQMLAAAIASKRIFRWPRWIFTSTTDLTRLLEPSKSWL